MTSKAEKIARDRDWPNCRRCGVSVHDRPASLHHRLPRRMGGSKSAEGMARIDQPSNLVILCGTGTTGCHHYTESWRHISLQYGWLLHANDDPATVPIIAHGWRIWLDNEGGEHVEEVGSSAPLIGGNL